MKNCQAHPQRHYVRYCHTLTPTPRIQRFRYLFDEEANKGRMGLFPRKKSRAAGEMEGRGGHVKYLA